MEMPSIHSDVGVAEKMLRISCQNSYQQSFQRSYLVYWRDGGKSRPSSQDSSCSCWSTKRKLSDEWMRIVILICPLISKIYIMQISTFDYVRKIETPPPPQKFGGYCSVSAIILGPCLLFTEERGRIVDMLVSGDSGCGRCRSVLYHRRPTPGCSYLSWTSLFRDWGGSIWLLSKSRNTPIYLDIKNARVSCRHLRVLGMTCWCGAHLSDFQS